MNLKVSAYISLIRPYQWIKNILIFSPLFFSAELFSDNTKLVKLFVATLCFCLLSSVGYIYNDWVDREKDLFHHTKKNRPLCSGRVSGLEAIFLSFILLLITFIILYILKFSDHFLILLALYFGLTTTYSRFLKNIILLELFAVSMGFVIRVLAGGAVCSITVSSWLFLTVFFISMMISVAKRLSEFDNLGKKQAIKHRTSQNGYTIAFLTSMLWSCGSMTLVVYALYVVEHTGVIVYSVLPATYGVIRYIYLADQGKASDPVKILFNDTQLLLTTLLFLIFMGFIIYYPF